MERGACRHRDDEARRGPSAGARGGRAASAGTAVVVRAAGLAEFLTAVPALRAIDDAFGDHRVVLAASRAVEPLARLSGVVDEVVRADDVALDARLERPAVAIDLGGPGSGSRRVLGDLDPRRLVAYGDPAAPRELRRPEWRDDEHEVARWCRLLRESGIPADPARLDLDVPTGAVPPWAHGSTLVHPGTSTAAKRWPPSRYGAVAAAEVADGRRVVIVTGPGEEELATAVREHAARRAAHLGEAIPGAIRQVVSPTVDTLAQLVAAAGRVVCDDIGVGHLATAVGTPSVVLFGPTPPTRWGPPPERPWHVALWAGRHEAPRGVDPHPGLLGIEVADVLLALARLPGPEAAPRRAVRSHSAGAGASRGNPWADNGIGGR